MTALSKLLAAAFVGAFALALLPVGSEAREPGGVSQARSVKRTPVRHRVAQRAYVPAPVTSGPAYAGTGDPRMPYGGSGRAQFEPVVIGAQPDRADGRTPEGP